MAPPNITLRGIRKSIPSGYMLGRKGGGRGGVELISIADVVQQAQAQGGGGSTVGSAGTGFGTNGQVWATVAGVAQWSFSTLITALGTITSGVWNATKIALAYGGTNADLSGTGGTSKFLRQNSAGAAIDVVRPDFSDLNSTLGAHLLAGTGISLSGTTDVTITATGGGTGTVTHTAGGLTLHAPIVGNGSADIKALAAMTDGQLMIGSTGNDPSLATLTAGSNITITNGAGTIQIAASGGSGTVTSVGMTVPAEFSVAGSPVTTTGTLAVSWAAPVTLAHGGSGVDMSATGPGYVKQATLGANFTVAATIPYSDITGGPSASAGADWDGPVTSGWANGTWGSGAFAGDWYGVQHPGDVYQVLTSRGASDMTPEYLGLNTLVLGSTGISVTGTGPVTITNTQPYTNSFDVGSWNRGPGMASGALALSQQISGNPPRWGGICGGPICSAPITCDTLEWIVPSWVDVTNNGVGPMLQWEGPGVAYGSATPAPGGRWIPSGATLGILNTKGVASLNAYAVAERVVFGASRANGTYGTPTQCLTNDVIGRYTWNGYGASGLNNPCARLEVDALENYTNTATGATVLIQTAPVGSNTAATVIDARSAGVAIQGTNTNDSAAAGKIGEYASSNVLTASAVALVTATAKDITTLTLTAGDWDVWGTVAFKPAATTTITQQIAAIGTAANTLPTLGDTAAMAQQSGSAVAGTGSLIHTGTCRVSLSAGATYHLVASSTFGTSTMAAYGYIAARRVR